MSVLLILTTQANAIQTFLKNEEKNLNTSIERAKNSTKVNPMDERVQYCVKDTGKCVIFGFSTDNGGSINFETDSQKMAESYNQLFTEFGVNDLYKSYFRAPEDYNRILNNGNTYTHYFSSYEDLVDQVIKKLEDPEIQSSALSCLESGAGCGITAAAALGTGGAAWAIPVVLCSISFARCAKMQTKIKEYDVRIKEEKDYLKDEIQEIADLIYDRETKEEEVPNESAPAPSGGGGDAGETPSAGTPNTSPTGGSGYIGPRKKPKVTIVDHPA